MTAWDWLLVVVLNGAVIAYALARGRETATSADWFLAGRTLPWWIIGLSLYATVIDSTDLVIDAGGTYTQGLRLLVINWVGVVGGWYLMANHIALPMYRRGMFTNAEYLEFRFTPLARAASVLVQVLYRTAVLGMIGRSLYLTLTVICNWNSSLAWSVVAAIALLATLYTMVGGLRSVAVTDALQSLVMVAASMIMFALVWMSVGGWQALERRLEGAGPGTSEQSLRIGSDRVRVESTAGMTPVEIERQQLLGGKVDPVARTISFRTPAWLVCLSLIIAGLAYAVVNHTQSMRMFGARSEWDLRLSVVLSSAILIVVTFLNLAQGVLGRALYPDLAHLPVPEAVRGTADAIFPLLVREHTVAGLRGIVVAGILAASLSTYDSIGSTLSALITRDVYARLWVKDRDDRHYLTVGRWLTPLIVFGSFLYVPLLERQTMIEVYLNIVSSFVVPLLTIYLMGTFTRVHRHSGSVGLVVGVAYGLWSLVAPSLATRAGVVILPPALMDASTTGPMCLLVTAISMLAYSYWRGWYIPSAAVASEATGWLRRSQLQIGDQESRSDTSSVARWIGLSVVALGLVLSGLVLW